MFVKGFFYPSEIVRENLRVVEGMVSMMICGLSLWCILSMGLKKPRLLKSGPIRACTFVCIG